MPKFKFYFMLLLATILATLIGFVILLIFIYSDKEVELLNYGSKFNEQWGLYNYGQEINRKSGKSGCDIDIINAWKITKGNSDILVGVLDTGIQISNSNIYHSIYVNENEIINGIDDDNNGYIDDINGWDFYNNDSTVYDDYLHDYHGTFITSIISSSHSNAIAGIAPNVKILPLKFMNGSSGDINDAIRAIEYAHSLGVDIINCSWDSIIYNSRLEETMKKYSDILFVCSSGKYKNDLLKVPTYPACFDIDNVICVTALNNCGELYEFSGYGSLADVAAPGCDVIGMYPDSEFSFSTGSSYAVAYVTGIAALIKSVNSDLNSAEIAEILKMGVKEIDGLHNLVASNGIIDAYECVKMARGRLK